MNFAALMMGAQIVSGVGQLLAGFGAKQAADLDAYNIETQKVMNDAEAVQRHNDRLEIFRNNLSSNIASFSLAGRDVGSDRSVEAFLNKQKKTAAEDTGRSDLMGMMEGLRLKTQAEATRSEGRAKAVSGTINAFSTVAKGLYDYNRVKADVNYADYP